jgi:hypothetical protein
VARLLALALLLASAAYVDAYEGGDEGKPAASPEPKKERKPAPKASPAPSYTNEDLKKHSDRPEGEATGEGATSAPSETTPAYSEGVSETPALVEGEWRSRAEERRQAIKAAELAVRGLEEESKALGLRILMSTDTYEILDLRKQQQEMNEQLEQARRSLAEAKQAQDDLETEARRSRVPPGWLRER